jgi:hypothetical protein
MKRPIIPFLAFLAVLLLTIPFCSGLNFDFATSVVPGWHATIIPPYFGWTIISIIILLFATIGYWLLAKRVDKINWTLFIVHFTLTIPTIIFTKFPAIFLDVQEANQNELSKNLVLRLNLIPVAWDLFFAGQILFVIYIIRATTNKFVAT